MSSIVDETPLVPVIHKSEFDDVAAKFLTAYCPEALETPMPVPIMNIARKKLGLMDAWQAPAGMRGLHEG